MIKQMQEEFDVVTSVNYESASFQSKSKCINNL